MSAAAAGNQRNLARLDLFASHEAEVAIEDDDVAMAFCETSETLVQHRPGAVHELFHDPPSSRLLHLSQIVRDLSMHRTAILSRSLAISLPSTAGFAATSPSSCRPVACSSGDHEGPGRATRS